MTTRVQLPGQLAALVALRRHVPVPEAAQRGQRGGRQEQASAPGSPGCTLGEEASRELVCNYSWSNFAPNTTM